MSAFDTSLPGRLLRSPAAVAKACADDEGLGSLAATAIATIGAGALVFGAAVGSWQGEAQVGFAAVKLALVSLGTLIVCVPAFYALAAVFGRTWSLRGTVATMLAAGARSSLVLIAATPVLWLAISLGAPYHLVKLLAALAYSLGGLAALRLLVRSVGAGRDRIATLATIVVVFLLVGGQTAWVLRPYIGDPDRGRIAFLTNEREGGLAYQLYVSACRVFGVRGDTP